MDDQTPISWDDLKDAQPPSTRLYFDLDEQTVDALELTLDHLRRAPGRPLSWKWVVVGMHAALHGSFGLALRRTEGAQLLPRWQERQYWERVDRERANLKPEAPTYSRPVRHEWRQHWVRSTSTKGRRLYSRKVRSTRMSRPREVERRVDQFLDLFKKTQKAHRMSHFGGVPLKPTPAQKRSVKNLNRIRNDLIHFSDTTLVTDVRPLLTDVTDGLAIVETLLTRTQNMAVGDPINTIIDPDLADRARQVIDDLQAELRMCWKRYDLTPPGSDDQRRSGLKSRAKRTPAG